jgi:hypothetical protein
MKIENNINRLQKFKKEVVSKIRKNEIPSNVNTSGNQTTSFDQKKIKKKVRKKKITILLTMNQTIKMDLKK